MPMRYSFQLKELRKRANLTQRQLAERVGVEQPTIQRWESGKQKPDLEYLDKLAVTLGVHPGELFEDQELAADPASTEAALRELAAAAVRSAGGNVQASSVRPIVHGLQRGLALLLRNPAIRTNADALAVAVHAIESPAPEATTRP
jgi:transcriptional regulator with XRE-family HTH domain